MNALYGILVILVLGVLVYLLAAIVAFALIHIPSTRKRIFSHFDKNLNQMYDEFAKKRYTSNDYKGKGKIAHYIKEGIKTYCDLILWDIKKIISPQRHISNINYLNSKRNTEYDYRPNNLIPDFVYEKSDYELGKLSQFLHSFDCIIRKAKKLCQPKKNDTAGCHIYISGPVLLCKSHLAVTITGNNSDEQ